MSTVTDVCSVLETTSHEKQHQIVMVEALRMLTDREGGLTAADLAQKAGLSPDSATQYLTTALPKLVDALTPNGNVGDASELLSIGKEILAAFAPIKEGE